MYSNFPILFELLVTIKPDFGQADTSEIINNKQVDIAL